MLSRTALQKLSSRKLLLAIFAIGLAIANKWADLGLDDKTITAVVFSTAAYIIGEGIADTNK